MFFIKVFGFYGKDGKWPRLGYDNFFTICRAIVYFLCIQFEAPIYDAENARFLSPYVFCFLPGYISEKNPFDQNYITRDMTTLLSLGIVVTIQRQHELI